MKKCSNCSVFIGNQCEKCPLCHHDVGPAGHSVTQYPSYLHQYRQIKSFTVTKLLFFLSIVGAVVCLTVNLMTLQAKVNLWSLVVIASLVYIWVMARNTIFSKMHISGKILFQFVSISVFIIVLDIYSQFFKWSTNYVIPFLAIATTFVITILAVSKKAYWTEYMGYIIATFFISISPMVLFAFRLSNVLWPSLSAIVYFFLTVTGLFIFSDKKFKEEIKKRFHL